MDGEVERARRVAEHGRAPRSSRTSSVGRRTFAPDGDCLFSGITDRFDRRDAGWVNLARRRPRQRLRE